MEGGEKRDGERLYQWQVEKRSCSGMLQRNQAITQSNALSASKKEGKAFTVKNEK